MMSNSSGFILGTIVGIGIGVAVSTLIFKEYFRREMEEEIASVKDTYANRSVKSNEPKEKASETYIIANIDKPKNIPEMHETAQIVNYNGYSKLVRAVENDAKTSDIVVTDEPDPETYDTHIDDPGDGDGGIIFDEYDDGDLYPTDDDPDPEEIDIEEYENDPEFEKVELLYYGLNDVLADENDEQVSKTFIGEDNLSLFFERNEPQIFIRNRSTGADYSVTLVNGKWTGDEY